MLRDKYSTRQCQVLYLSFGMPLSAVYFVHMRLGGTLSSILYFELATTEVYQWIFQMMCIPTSS